MPSLIHRKTITMIPSSKASKKARPIEQHQPSTMKWRAIAGLVFVYAAVLLNWQWIWGALFLFWVIPDFFTGVTYFMEPIERKTNPILYWFIMISWVLMSLFSISTAFFPELNYY